MKFFLVQLNFGPKKFGPKKCWSKIFCPTKFLVGVRLGWIAKPTQQQFLSLRVPCWHILPFFLAVVFYTRKAVQSALERWLQCVNKDITSLRSLLINLECKTAGSTVTLAGTGSDRTICGVGLIERWPRVSPVSW